MKRYFPGLVSLAFVANVYASTSPFAALKPVFGLSAAAKNVKNIDDAGKSIFSWRPKFAVTSTKKAGKRASDFVSAKGFYLFTAPAPPVISYASPKTYAKGVAIAALSPVNTGGAVPANIYAQVTTLAGSGAAGSANGTGAAATFNGLIGMATDAAGNIYTADYTANVIRKITPAGVATTFAGSGAAGAANGTGTAATFKNPSGIAVDAAGNVYVGDTGNNLIRKITPAGVVTTFAGSSTAGAVNGTGTAAKFKTPRGLAIDGAGNLYVADYGNSLIRKITPAGVVTTLAGSGAVGATNGASTAASFNGPIALTTDAAGNVYVADYSNKLIRKVTPAGVVSTLAGSGATGATNGTGTAASFNGPYAVAIDATGNVYVGEALNNLIRKITPAGIVTTLAGSGAAGSGNGTGASATFNSPHGMAIDGQGNMYVSDYTNHQVRKVLLTGYTISPALPAGLSFNAATGVITGTPMVVSAATNYTITAYNTGGSGTFTLNITINNPVAAPVISYASPKTFAKGVAIPALSPVNTGGSVPANTYAQVTTFAGSGAAGSANGTGTAASFKNPAGITTDTAGNAYIADYSNHLIRKITPAGVVTTLAGSGIMGATNGTGAAASFKNPYGLAVDAGGNVFVADYGNNLIRKITSAGVVTTFAGSGAAGAANGTGAAASFNHPSAIAIDNSGNLYVADYGNNLIRKITPAAVVSTFAGSGIAGAANGTGTAASFKSPIGTATDVAGNVYVADYGNNLIRKITPAGVVTTLAGSGVAGSANGTGTAASFNSPRNIVIGPNKSVYVADYGNNAIREIKTSGQVRTVAGGTAGAVNGTGAAASFKGPIGISADVAGNLFVTDFNNNLIRKISTTGYSISPTLPAGLGFNASTGVITGTPTAISAAKNYTVTAYNTGGSSTVIVNITINQQAPVPQISYSNSNFTFIKNSPVTPLNPVNTGGVVPEKAYGDVTAFTGQGPQGAGAANGNLATATFNGPNAAAFDAAGNMYVADFYNSLIRKITPAGVVTTLAGSGSEGSANGTGTEASFNGPSDIAIDSNGNLYVADEGDNLIRKITPAGVVSTFAGSGAQGSANGTGTAASFSLPVGITIDAANNLYVAELGSNLVRKITSAGVVSTFAGSGSKGSVNGTGTSASFNQPLCIEIDAAGNLYVGGLDNLIRKITPAGVVSTLAGTTGVTGSTNGTGPAASFNWPSGLATDAAGNVYVADYNNHLVRKITPDGVVTTLAGLTGVFGNTNGIGTAATLNYPVGLTIKGGDLYVIEQQNNGIRKISTTGYTINPALPPGLAFNTATGEIAGTPFAARTATDYTITAYNTAGSGSTTINITVTAGVSGAPNINYGASAYVFPVNSPISPLSPSNSGGQVPASVYGQVSTFAGSGNAGAADGQASIATFKNPTATATDTYGNVYVTDSFNHLIRKITPAGQVTTFAGSGVRFDNNVNSSAMFHYPDGISADASFNIYVSDTDNNLVRKITLDGAVTTLAGSGAYGSANGTGSAATFSGPTGIATNSSSNSFVVESAKNLIRKISQFGEVSTFAGNGQQGSHDGAGNTAQFYHPHAAATDDFGNVYVTDADNHKIRKITSSGTVSTFAGNAGAGSDDGAGSAASFSKPWGIAADGVGNIYVSDLDNQLIRKITPGGVVTTLAGTVSATGSANGEGTQASFNSPGGLSVDRAGYLYIADSQNNLIRKISTTGYSISPALPPGLTFDATVGVISGAPTATSPATNYTITAYNTDGSSTTTIKITIGGQGLFMANSLQETPIAGEPMVKQSMSPNGDGKSDVLAIENIEQYPDNKIVIMSAGGAKVYEASGYGTDGKAFDGHSSITGKLQVAGTYLYQLEYRATDGVKRKNGYFVIKY